MLDPERCSGIGHKGFNFVHGGQAVIPLEMISVLIQFTSSKSGFRIKGSAIGLFAAQEIKMINGPLFVDDPYKLEREIIVLSESRRTESNWIMTRVTDAETDTLCAEVILNSAPAIAYPQKDRYRCDDQSLDARSLPCSSQQTHNPEHKNVKSSTSRGEESFANCSAPSIHQKPTLAPTRTRFRVNVGA